MCAIKVFDYDPCWPRLFAEISSEVSALLGDRLLSIDQIGIGPGPLGMIPEIIAKQNALPMRA
ncbi:hypothetical protein ACC736_39935, partial [Rhizobium ruizarguesonis]